MSNLPSSYDSLLDRVVKGVITLIALAIGVRWAVDLLRPVIPLLVVGFVVVTLSAAGWWVWRRRHWERW